MARAASPAVRAEARALRIKLLRDLGRDDEADALERRGEVLRLRAIDEAVALDGKRVVGSLAAEQTND
jgi:hypothetical protein